MIHLCATIDSVGHSLVIWEAGPHKTLFSWMMNVLLASQVGSFSFGGIFGATRDRLRQHPQALWQTILSRCTENNAMGYFIERSWLMLLDPGFAACDSPEPRLEVFRNLNTSALECQPAGASRLQRLSLHLQAAANRHLLRG